MTMKNELIVATRGIEPQSFDHYSEFDYISLFAFSFQTIDWN